MVVTLFAAVKDDGGYEIIRIRFKTYLPNNGYDVSWVDGELMALGYYAIMIFSEGATRFFNENECTLIELE